MAARAAAWLWLILMCACCGARAETPVTLFKSYAGNVNFTGTQASMRVKANNKPCDVVSDQTEITATVSGIPSSATILNAQLYWAGSGSSADYSVTFQRGAVSAPDARRYVSATAGGGLNYFSGAADVTAQVIAKGGNGSYTFRDLTISSGAPYCNVEGVLGGFSLLVIYSDPGEPFRVLNLYEGFQSFHYSGITLNLSNFRVSALNARSTGRLGHITWEGDATLQKNGEDLLFNGVEMTDKLNPPHNQFNSASNINGDKSSYGIDFDAYTLSSNMFRAGQTSATTRYQSAQDLVLLSAEIVALPNVPTADLELFMTLDTPLVVLQNAGYTLTLRNNGPSVETGPVKVSDTLPDGLSVVAASGAGWSCVIAGQKISCSHDGPLAAGASLPPLSVTVKVLSAGTWTNTASVTGALFDNIGANNTRTDSTVTSGSATTVFVFTDRACTNGKPFAENHCMLYTGPYTAGAAASLFVTAVSNGVPAQVSAAASTQSMQFALSCLNPASNAGVAAHYAGATLPLCSADGAAPGNWSPAVSMSFGAGSPSALASGFVYADVGRIQLYLRDAAGRLFPSPAFVSRPHQMALTQVRRSADGFPNPPASAGNPYGFIAAGELFSLRVEAWTSSGAVTPNFGREALPLPELGLDRACPPEGTPEGDAMHGSCPELQSSADWGAALGGGRTGAGFSWNEVGMLTLTPSLADYLGSGAVAGRAESVGRFYPHHFKTEIVADQMPCMARMACPASVTLAAYSGQPFRVAITPMSAGSTPLALNNYRGVFGAPITLSAYDRNGGTLQNPAAGSLSGTVAAALAPDAAMPTPAAPAYSLPHPFSNATPRALDLTAPTPVFVRASAVEKVNTALGSVTVSSELAQTEGGIMVVSGRLHLVNAYGSELLPMPVKMAAQFWAASAAGLAAGWQNASADNASSVNRSAIAFSNCSKKLLTAGNCNTGVLGVADGSAVTLQNGAATLRLKAPGRGNVGSAAFQMNNPVWLPSTLGHAVFGLDRSPLIYVREMY